MERDANTSIIMGWKIRDEKISGWEYEEMEGGPIDEIIVDGNACADRLSITQGKNQIMLDGGMALKLKQILRRCGDDDTDRFRERINHVMFMAHGWPRKNTSDLTHEELVLLVGKISGLLLDEKNKS